MRVCDQTIVKLKQESEQRDKELERKRVQLGILKAKNERIQNHRDSVERYQFFLQLVKEQNNDEFREVSDIRNRYVTLKTAQEQLTKQEMEMHDQVEKKKGEVSSYERVMQNRIMQLNVQIAEKTAECEHVEKLKNDKKLNVDAADARKLD